MGGNIDRIVILCLLFFVTIIVFVATLFIGCTGQGL